MAIRKARLLEGQTALVTGGGKGIGRSMALALAARGVRVVVTGRDERALGETVGEIAHAGGKGRHIVADVRIPADLDAAVARAIETFGGLDIAIANAGISGRVELGGGAAGRERARAIVETNLLGAYHLFDAALSAMKGPGRLLATSSALANFGVAGYAAYCASKSGLLGLVRATAVEVGARGITCNALTPGWIDTDMADARLREIAEAAAKPRDDVKREAIAAFPLGRFIEPDEVAELVVFLCSSGGDAITGQAISICGGATSFGS
jgi:NAD(P)-dependent dehydrogenase (short-subunit alcohol dehydrogenase family)